MAGIWLTDLADVIRKHTSLRVIEEPGWKTRGHRGMTAYQATICHHTAGRPTEDNPYPSLKTVRDGRPGLDGPLAQLGLQGDCAVRVIAAGVCFHAGVVFETWQNNDHALGIEAEHPGGDAPWDPEMYAAYVELCAGLEAGYAGRHGTWHGTWGHKEIAKPKGRKPDPTFSMPALRAAVDRFEPPKGTTPNPPEGELTMADAASLEALAKSNADLAGKRWKQTQDAIDAHDRQEDARYTELHTVHEKVDALTATAEALTQQLAAVIRRLDAQKPAE